MVGHFEAWTDDVGSIGLGLLLERRLYKENAGTAEESGGPTGCIADIQPVKFRHIREGYDRTMVFYHTQSRGQHVALFSRFGFSIEPFRSFLTIYLYPRRLLTWKLKKQRRKPNLRQSEQVVDFVS